MELVAHRAANAVRTIAPAAEVADVLEADLHLLRGRIEVRHEKVLWPWRIYWERTPRIAHVPGLDPPVLAEILVAAGPDLHLWFDLKGYTSRLARRALDLAGGRRDLTVSSRMWWTLRPARRAGLRTFRSVGSRSQLWLARRVRYGPRDGVVMHERFAHPDVVRELTARAGTVFVWAVHDRDRARELAELGVHGIIADDLDLLTLLRADAGR